MRNKCLGVFLVFCAFPMVILSIMMMSSQHFYKVEFYKNLLSNTKSYPKIVDYIHQAKTEDELSSALIANITPQWLEQNVNKNLDILFNYLSKKSPDANFTLDIRPFKSEIEAQIPAGTGTTIPDDVSFSSYNTFLEDIRNNNTDFSKFINKKNVDQQITTSQKYETKTNNNLKNAQRAYYYSKIASYVIYALTIVILLLIVLAAMRYPPAILRWVGQALFIPSILLAINVIIIRQIVYHWDWLSKLKLATEIHNIIRPIYLLALKNVIFNMMAISLITSAIGLIMIIISYIWSHYRPMPKIETQNASRNIPEANPQPLKQVESISRK